MRYLCSDDARLVTGSMLVLDCHRANSAGLAVAFAEFRLLTDAGRLAQADPPGGVGQADAVSGETSPGHQRISTRLSDQQP